MKINVYYPINKHGDPSRSTPPLEMEIQHVFASEAGILVLVKTNKNIFPLYYGLVDYEEFIGLYPVFNPPTSGTTDEIQSAPYGATINLITGYEKYGEQEQKPIWTEYEKVNPDELFEFIQNRRFIHVMKDIRTQQFIIKSSK
jgi:hypothetical protein